MTTPAPGKSPRGYVLIALGWLATLGVVWLMARLPQPRPVEVLPVPSPVPTATAAPSATPLPSATPSPLRIDMAGAVRNPGVYRLPPGSIVADAIAAAGGPAPDADTDRLNRAARLEDGMQVYVPQAGESALPTPLLPRSSLPARLAPTDNGQQPIPGPSAARLIDINQATAEELETLPGIGPALAGRIVTGRPYAGPDDLLRVPGIGPAILSQIKPHITTR